MGGFLDRATLNELLDELARALERKRVRGHVYLVGGAAMMLAFSRERSTHDADARIESGHGAVIEAARAIGRKHGIGESWLNEQATHYMPRARDERARTLYDSPYLVVTGASAEHMLAMKLEAGRDTDQEDVAKLVETLGITTPGQGLAIHARLFPDSNQRERAETLLEAAVRPVPQLQAEPKGRSEENSPERLAPIDRHSP